MLSSADHLGSELSDLESEDGQEEAGSGGQAEDINEDLLDFPGTDED